MPNHVPATTIKERARELRALSEKKSAAFRERQIGATLEILTLRHTNESNAAQSGTTESAADNAAAQRWTPAISTNYLQLRLTGVFEPNQLLRARITSHENGMLHATFETNPETKPEAKPETQIETKSNFAVHHAASGL
jgi:tRNA A37 methylthiotransferase MiaB